jgi:hypothetical protein
LVFNWFSFTTRLVIEFTSNVSTSASAHTAHLLSVLLIESGMGHLHTRCFLRPTTKIYYHNILHSELLLVS